jgi:hypothetical protein
MKLVFSYYYRDNGIVREINNTFEAESVEAAKEVMIQSMVQSFREYEAEYPNQHGKWFPTTGYTVNFLNQFFDFFGEEFIIGNMMSGEKCVAFYRNRELFPALTWDDLCVKILTLDEWFERKRIDK